MSALTSAGSPWCAMVSSTKADMAALMTVSSTPACTSLSASFLFLSQFSLMARILTHTLIRKSVTAGLALMWTV